MNNDLALAVLERVPTATQSERLQAARFLSRNATPACRDRVSRARAIEPNSWVQQALDRALKRSGMISPYRLPLAVRAVVESSPDVQAHDEIRAQAIEETSAMFLHELRPLVGFIDDAAEREISYYKCSETKQSVARVRSFLETIQRLRKASAAPLIQEFNLTDLVLRVATDEVRQGRATLNASESEETRNSYLENDVDGITERPIVELSLGGQGPVVTMGDPALIEITLANALRNAIEATLEVPECRRRAIILNWGMTNTDNWVVVLDHGCGLPPGADRVNELGTSTKSKDEGHLGMGLPIAQRAIQSLDGSLRLTPRAESGVSCEVRWPREATGK